MDLAVKGLTQEELLQRFQTALRAAEEHYVNVYIAVNTPGGAPVVDPRTGQTFVYNQNPGVPIAPGGAAPVDADAGKQALEAAKEAVEFLQKEVKALEPSSSSSSSKS